MTTVDWIPVSERLPEQLPLNYSSEDVLIWIADLGCASAGSYHYRARSWFFPSGTPAGHVTHWAEMPKGPS